MNTTQFNSSRENAATPEGALLWPSVHEPDTTFNTEGGGDYKITLRLHKDTAEKLVNTITQFRDQCVNDFAARTGKSADNIRKAPLPYRDEFKKDGDGIESKTDHLLFTFRKRASFSDKKTGRTVITKVPIYDKFSVAQLTKPIQYGAIGCVGFTMNSYMVKGEIGVSLKLGMLRVHDFGKPYEVTADNNPYGITFEEKPSQSGENQQSSDNDDVPF